MHSQWLVGQRRSSLGAEVRPLTGRAIGPVVACLGVAVLLNSCSTTEPSCSIVSVLVAPANPEVAMLSSLPLVVAISAANCDALPVPTWESSNPAVATVDPTSGVVTGIAEGVAMIGATVGERIATTQVTVTPAMPASVAVALTATTVERGFTTEALAVVRDAAHSVLRDRMVSWAVTAATPAGAATVHPTSGLVTGVAAGTATITATVVGTFPALRASVQLTITPIQFVEITAGYLHTCGRTPSLAVYCWGVNNFGQLGDGTTTWRATPTRVSGGHAFVEISAGALHTCGRTTGNEALCWGANSFGQAGTLTGVDVLAPTRVDGGLTFVQLSAGGRHTCGRTPTGAAYCWGDNTQGQLGNPTPSFPRPVAGGLLFASLSVGGQHTCGRTAANVSYCWGSNSGGQLGDNTTTDRSVPTVVTGGAAFVVLAAGVIHTCGRTAAGSAFCWGMNNLGGLGDNTTTRRLVPTLVAGGVAFVDLALGLGHTCGRTTTGAVYCWGADSSGQLGDGETTFADQLVPTLVVGGVAFIGLAAGDSHTCARPGSAATWCWGDNYAGQLGDGTQVNRGFPVRVVDP